MDIDRDALFLHSTRMVTLPILYICTLLVGVGYFARPASAGAALIWAAAAVTGMRARESWFNLRVRDCEFAFLFVALAFTGPGRFSLEHWLKWGFMDRAFGGDSSSVIDSRS